MSEGFTVNLMKLRIRGKPNFNERCATAKTPPERNFNKAWNTNQGK
jgi:hypothetical protein